MRGPDGAPVALRPTASRLLDALLASHGKEVAATELIDRVWGDTPPGDPMASLHQTVARLRRALPDDSIRRTKHGYVLTLPDGVLLDDHPPATAAPAAVGSPPARTDTAPAFDAESLRLASSSTRAPFVGRDRLLTTAVADAEDGIGTVFHGIAGNGKSRLVEEVVLELSRRGHPSALLSCRAAGSGTPLGVFVSLLPDTIPREGVSMVVAAREAITERVGGGRLVLGLDDVHLLDGPSAALVSQLVTAGTAVLDRVAPQHGRRPHARRAALARGLLPSRARARARPGGDRAARRSGAPPNRHRRDGRGAVGADARQPPVRDHRARPSRLHHCRVRRHRRAADRRPTRRPATRAARRAGRHRPRRAARGDDHGAPQRHRRPRRPRTPAPHPSRVRRPPARHQRAPPGVRRARPGDDVAAPRPRDPRPAHRRRPGIRCTTSRRPRPSRRLVGQGRTAPAAGSRDSDRPQRTRA